MSHTLGWRFAIAAVAFLTLIAAFLIHQYVRETPRVPKSSSGSRQGFYFILTLPALLLIFPLNFFNYSVVAAERGVWLAPFLSAAYHLDDISISYIAMLMATGMTIGALVSGYTAKAIGGTKWTAAIAAFIVAIGFCVLGLYPNLPLWMVTLIYATLGFFGLFYTLGISHGRQFLPESELGRGITTMNFLSIGGVGLLQAASGRWVSASGHEAVQAFNQLHLAFGLLLFIAVVIFCFSPISARHP